MRTYIVSKPVVNIRSDATDPSDASFAGQLLEGDTVMLSEETVTGRIPLGGTSDQWFLHQQGNVLPLEGLRPAKFSDKAAEFSKQSDFSNLHKGLADPANWLVNWGFADLEIWKVWRDFKTRGEKVRVAVIDTGAVFQDNDLQGKVDTSHSIGFDGSLVDTDAPEYHGTRTAGLIAADGATAGQVYGLAPACTLVIYRLYSNDGMLGYSLVNLQAVLQKAQDEGVDVINMSFSRQDDMSALLPQIQACLKKNILLVASVGNDPQSSGVLQNYPASFAGVLTVGAYQLAGDNRQVLTDHSAQNKNLICLAPGSQLRTTGNTGDPVMHDYSSAAAGMLSGVLALLVAHLKAQGKSISAPDVLERLPQACQKIGSSPGRDTSEGYGVINPYQLLTLF